jgi:hypothetical protein
MLVSEGYVHEKSKKNSGIGRQWNEIIVRYQMFRKEIWGRTNVIRDLSLVAKIINIIALIINRVLKWGIQFVGQWAGKAHWNYVKLNNETTGKS